MTLSEPQSDAFGLPPLGHNNPPPTTLEEQMAEAAAELLSIRDEKYAGPIATWLSRKELADDEQEELATNFIAKARDLSNRFEALRIEKKEPFLRDSRLVDAFFKSAVNPVDGAVAHVRRLLDAHKKKKLDAARAEQTRLAEEARKAAAAATTMQDMQHAAQLATQAAAPVEPIRTHADSGAMSSMRIEYVAEVVNLEEVPRQFLSYDERKVKAWLAGLPKGTVPPAQPGLKFNETVKSIVRK